MGRRTRRARRLAAWPAAAVLLAASLAACSSAAGAAGSQPADIHSPSAPVSTPVASSSPSLPTGPVLQVTGAPKGVKAKGAIVVDADTGQVLWGRDVDTERPMASVTKVMTALLVMKSGGLNEKIKVTKAAETYAWKYGGETASLRPGDTFTAQQLMTALLLASGADAAYMLASTFGPGLTAFVAKMNATAAQLGMKNTHFASPDGLPYPTETSTYSTPSDLVMLGLAAMRYPAFRSIVDLNFYNLPKGSGHNHYWWQNTSAFIGSYKGAIGIKDGYTDDAGHCLLFEAVRNGRHLIGVALDSPSSGVSAAAQDAGKMLNWGFGLQLAK